MRKFSQFTPDEDTPLLLSWYRGDLSAFETLIWKYQKRIFNLVLLLTGLQKTACDVAENTFITAYQNIKSLKSTGRFSSWLVAIALKECRERENFRGEGAQPPADPEPVQDTEGSYSAALHKKLVLCIRVLPVELSELILLRYVRGYSLERIEEILQISGELLLSRLFEAQETLACWLKSGTEDPAELSGMRTAVSSIHPGIRRSFSAYLDNSIEGDEKEQTKAHLKSCGSCREALAELEWMVEDIRSIPDVEPPHWLAASIIQKVTSSPAEPVKVRDSSHFQIQAAVAVLFIAVLGASAFFLQDRSENRLELPRSGTQIISSPVVEQKNEPAGTDFTAIMKGVFRGGAATQARLPGTESESRSSLPLPALVPSEQESQPAPSREPVQPAAAGQSSQAQKRERGESLSPLLQEWGEPPPPVRIPPKKAPLPRARVGELAVVLTSADPVAAAHDIESAVISIGGRINGRAFSAGSDILYTRVEVERFIELMGRLGKIGRIQELPQLPEDVEGAVDLVIKW